MSLRARWMVLAALSVAPADAAATPSPECGGGHYLAGIDVSSYQGEIDWKQVKRAGIVFAFARVSDGLEAIDTRFAENVRGMRRARIRRGAYQYFRASLDPKAQADLFVKKLSTAGHFDLPPVLDLETTDGMSVDDVRQRAKRWLRRVEQRTGRRPIVYTSPSMSEALGNGFAAYPLWVAHYDVECPTVPAGWKRWHFWQHSSSGQVAGIAGKVDVDIFAGTLAALRRLP